MTLTVTDVNGNVSTCTATITVEDNVAPTAICQDLTVQLDATGAGSITAAQVDNGSSDNCGIDTMTLSKTDFDCTNVGANTVTLTVTDDNGNVSTCTATITVQDNINPTAICQNLTVQLDASGAASITAAQVDNGSFDNCAVATTDVEQDGFRLHGRRRQHGDLDSNRCQQQREHLHGYHHCRGQCGPYGHLPGPDGSAGRQRSSYHHGSSGGQRYRLTTVASPR